MNRESMLRNRYLAAGECRGKEVRESVLEAEQHPPVILVSSGNVFTHFMALAYLETIETLVFPLRAKQFSLLLVGSGFIFS